LKRVTLRKVYVEDRVSIGFSSICGARSLKDKRGAKQFKTFSSEQRLPFMQIQMISNFSAFFL